MLSGRSRAQDEEMINVQDASCAGLDSLPLPLLVRVLPKATVDRVRAVLVCKRWAALLREPAFWSDLCFEGARAERLSFDTVLSLARRSAGAGGLHSLDLSSPSCRNCLLPPRRDGQPLLLALAAAGLTANLRSLALAPSDAETTLLRLADNKEKKPGWRLWGSSPAPEEPLAAGARRLRAALPALSYADLPVTTTWAGAVAVMKELPGVTVRSLTVRGTGTPPPPPRQQHPFEVLAELPGAVAGLAEAFAAAHALCPVERLHVHVPPAVYHPGPSLAGGFPQELWEHGPRSLVLSVDLPPRGWRSTEFDEQLHSDMRTLGLAVFCGGGYAAQEKGKVQFARAAAALLAQPQMPSVLLRVLAVEGEGTLNEEGGCAALCFELLLLAQPM